MVPIVSVSARQAPANPWIDHIVNVSNLRSIAQHDLLCATTMHDTGRGYANIAHASIQSTRASKQIRCGPQGCLHDYVPFYFAPCSPMLSALYYNNVPGHQGGQTPIVHLVSSVGTIVGRGLPFVFTDGHGTKALTKYFDNLKDLDKVDWAIMEEKYWTDTEEDGDRKRRRQAEFLVHSSVPWTLIEEIGVIDARMSSMVHGILAGLPYIPPVNVQRGWYY